MELNQASESPRGLAKYRLLGPVPFSFWFNRSGVELRICISKKFPADVNAAYPGTTLLRTALDQKFYK